MSDCLSQKDSVILVHCIYGQSRSCCVCIAYLMRCCMEKNYSTSKYILNETFSEVLLKRPCMAINPGFIRQLQIYQKMLHHKIYNDNRCTFNFHESIKDAPPQSRAHATFRSMRVRSKYNENANDVSIVNFFHPLIPYNDYFKSYIKTTTISLNNSPSISIYRCKKCRFALFSDLNIPWIWSDFDVSILPCSDYWKDSTSGNEFLKQYSSRLHNFSITKELCATKYPLEPMEWMKLSMFSDKNMSLSEGKLSCPFCQSKIGTWNWSCLDPYVFIFISKSKFDSYNI